MKKTFLFLLAMLPFMAWAQGDTLIDQSQFVTEPGAVNGYDISRLHPDHVSYGPGINFDYGYMLCDDFELTGDSHITGLEVYGYQSYTTTTSTMTGLYFVIYDQNPMSGGEPIWGDLVTNRMTATEWTGCYRCGHSGSNPNNTERPIMSVTASDLDIALPAGKYYLAWGLTGSAEYGPYGMPVCIPGQAVTGDALQYDGAGWWRELYLDQNYQCPVGAAFILFGYNDPTGLSDNESHFALSPNPTNGMVNIEAPDLRHVTVRNLTGQIVYDTEASGDSLQLDLGQFKSGVYLVQISTSEAIETRRVTLVK